ncbi:MAG TPA: hypothetical protein VEJ17_00170 [Candidatus Nitrosotalea sp.]|nr:hypothetical protein [Candidatus Nitrosotalea sp.]
MTGTLAGSKLAAMPTTSEEFIQASPKRCALFVFLTFIFLYMMTSSGRVRTVDEYMAFFETESIALRGSTAVPQAVQLNYYYGKYDARGEPHTPYPPGHPLFALPWYLFGRYVVEKLPGMPVSGEQMILEAAVCFSSAVFSASAVTFMFLICYALGLDVLGSLATAAIMGLATPVFTYSSWFFSEPLTTALLLAAAYFVFARHKGELIPVSAAAIGGSILGVAICVRPAHALAAALFFGALLLRDRTKALWPALIFGFLSAIGLAALLLYNFHLYGNALEFGYPAIAEGGKRLNSFETPILTGLFGLLFSPGKSIFVFAPPLILALAGLPRLWRRDRGLGAIAAGALPVYLLFYARYSQWEGGYCVGPRYMVPALALLCIGLAPVIAEAKKSTRAAAIVLTAIGVAVQLLSIATSFMESQVPAGVYYGPNWTYNMRYSLWSQAKVLLHHLANPAPARVGLGFDRWFVFLAKVGVAHSTLAALFCVMLIGGIISEEGLRRSIKNCRRNAE